MHYKPIRYSKDQLGLFLNHLFYSSSNQLFALFVNFVKLISLAYCWLVYVFLLLGILCIFRNNLFKLLPRKTIAELK